MSLRLGIAKTRLLLIPILALIGLLCLVNRVSAADEVVKAEMYMGDYEIRANKVGTSFVYEEVKYIETGSAKVIKKRTSTTNTWVSSYYHTNHQGSTSVVSNNQGRVDTEYSKGRLRYFPYGEQITNHNINTQVVADTYTGQKRDTESNLMFYNARLYNQKTGLFMQADSVNDGLNRYMYVGGNPTNKIDPTGNRSIEDDDRLGPEDRAELLADRRRADEAKRRRKAYVDKGVLAFSKAFATWYPRLDPAGMNNPCYWNNTLCDWQTPDFNGLNMANYAFEALSGSYANLNSNPFLTFTAQGDYLLDEIEYDGEGKYFTASMDASKINSSRLANLNLGVVLSVYALEMVDVGRYDDSWSPTQYDNAGMYLCSHVGEDALIAALNSSPNVIDMYDALGQRYNYDYSNDSFYIGRQIASLSYTLRYYQGEYLRGGNFSALSEDGSNLNPNVFSYYNANPIWYPRANAIYQSLYNFASQNKEYSWLIENLVD